MNKLSFLLVALFFNSYLFAQGFELPANSDYPNLPRYGKSINGFVPRNWKIFGKTMGDLNGDGKEDCALVIKANYAKFLYQNEYSSDPFDTNPRILFILFKDANGYRLAKQNNRFIIVPDSPAMSEPFQKIRINNRVLQLDFELWYSAGSWSAYQHSYKFRFRNGEFVLIGADETTWIRNSGETETGSYNFLTNKMKITTGSIENIKKKIQWKEFKVKKLRTLDTVKEPFTWERI